MKSNTFHNITQQLIQNQNSTTEMKKTNPNEWFRFKRDSDSIANPMLIEPNPYFDLKQEPIKKSNEKKRSKHRKRFTLASKRDSMPSIAGMEI